MSLQAFPFPPCPIETPLGIPPRPYPGPASLPLCWLGAPGHESGRPPVAQPTGVQAGEGDELRGAEADGAHVGRFLRGGWWAHQPLGGNGIAARHLAACCGIPTRSRGPPSAPSTRGGADGGGHGQSFRRLYVVRRCAERVDRVNLCEQHGHPLGDAVPHQPHCLRLGERPGHHLRLAVRADVDHDPGSESHKSSTCCRRRRRPARPGRG